MLKFSAIELMKIILDDLHLLHLIFFHWRIILIEFFKSIQ